MVVGAQVTQRDERQIELRRDHRVLVPGATVRPVGEQHDAGIGIVVERCGAQRSGQEIEGAAEGAPGVRGLQAAVEHFSRRGRVSQPGRGADVVFEHEEATLPVAHDVEPRYRDRTTGGRRDSLHLRRVQLGVVDHRSGYHPGLHDAPVGVDVGGEGVERADTLGEPRFERGPLVGRNQPRHRVDGERTTTRPTERHAAAGDVGVDAAAQDTGAALGDVAQHAVVVRARSAVVAVDLIVGRGQDRRRAAHRVHRWSRVKILTRSRIAARLVAATGNPANIPPTRLDARPTVISS